MTRTAIVLLFGLMILSVGCEPPKPAGSGPSNGGGPAAPGGTSTPAPPVIPAPLSGGISTLTLAAAHESQARPARQLIEVLDSIQDDATATAAAPRIQQLGGELATGMKQFKATVAAYELGGKKREVDEFFEKQIDKRALADADLMGKIERVVASPQGPLVQGAVNSLLDNMLEAATSGTRRGLEQVIRQKQLRR